MIVKTGCGTDGALHTTSPHTTDPCRDAAVLQCSAELRRQNKSQEYMLFPHCVALCGCEGSQLAKIGFPCENET